MKLFKVSMLIWITFAVLFLGCALSVGIFLWRLDREAKLMEEMFNGDKGYTYRENTLFAYECQHARKHFFDDIKHKRIDLDIVLSIMENEGVTIQEMDSIMGDTLWRMSGFE